MDIKISRNSVSNTNDFEGYATERLEHFFEYYPFIQSFKIFLRGKKHPTKKVKLQLRLKGKDVFASAKGDHHHDAFDAALVKIKSQLARYKTDRYKAA